MAGIAGAVIVPYLTAQANMGYPITLMFLCIVVVAGHGSVKGSCDRGDIIWINKEFWLSLSRDDGYYSSDGSRSDIDVR